MPDFPATDPLFLSTLSLRRATPRPSPSCHPVWDFYPHSPCGERPGTIGAAAGTAAISIHALLTESDRPSAMLSSGREYFYPRSPYGERRIILRNRISLSADFYPRSPYGERRSRSFLSMSKVWIYIHALLTESDREWRGHQRQW